MSRPDLDRWLQAPALRTCHQREAAAAPDALWRAANDVRLAECRLLGRMVRWRIPGLSPELTYGEMFRAEPFTLLDEGPGHSLSGLVGRIWTLRRDYPRLGDPGEFSTWCQAGTARVLFAHWVERAGTGRARLTSEVRIAAPDRGARRGLRAVRPLVGAFEHLIAGEPLALAVRRAED